jgi:hypothetical protein
MNFLMSDSIGKISAALAKAQLNMTGKGPKKDNLNPHFKSRYSDIESVLEAARANLAPQEIAISQHPLQGCDGYVEVLTMLSHSSGEWIRSWCKIRTQKDDPQGFGSALTYALRRTALAVCGMAPEDDDDGNASSHPPTPSATQATAARPAVSGYRPQGSR